MTSRPAGILVVDRASLMERAASAGVLEKRKPDWTASGREVFQRYRGFDGTPWPTEAPPEFSLQGGLADPLDWAQVSAYLSKMGGSMVDALLLSPAPAASEIDDGWKLAGFDIGVFESEWSHYSVILNEILFGTRAELRRFSTRLNTHLLFSGLEEARSVLETRASIASTSELEDLASPRPIAVHIRSGPGAP